MVGNILNYKGFTLIELSIVIVIIGLIVAGVVGGQTLVEQAKIRGVMTQMNQIKIAANAYKLEYGELPGDHTRAADYWGQAANCFANVSGSTNTCNGDGSGKLSYNHGCDSSGVRHEMWHFWKHLSNAELIEGDYSAYSPGGLRLIPGENAPKGSINGTGWTAFSVATCNIGRQWIGRPKNQNANRIVFSNPNASGANGTWFSNAVALSAQQQFNVDNKIDDGLPYQGIINDMSSSHSGFSIDCATVSNNEFGNSPPGTSTINATYDLSFKGAACIMFVDVE